MIVWPTLIVWAINIVKVAYWNAYWNAYGRHRCHLECPGSPRC